MIQALISIIVGILGTKVENANYFIISILILSVILILYRPSIVKKILLFSIITFVFFVYTSLLINDVEDSTYKTGQSVNSIFVVEKELGSGYVCNSKKDKYLVYTNKEYLPGDILLIEGNVSDTQVKLNPYIFDLKSYYRQKRISRIVFVDKERLQGVSRKVYYLVIRKSYQTRNWVLDQLAKKFDNDELAFLQSIMTGYKKELSQDTYENFQKTGITHIMSVSGAHVAFILLPFLFIFNRTIKNEKIRSLLLTIPPIVYIFITGIKPSILRATIMVIIFMFSKAIKKEKNTLNIIFFTCIVMLVYNPFYIFETGFILSFLSTFGIILLNKPIYSALKLKKIPNLFGKSISISLSAQIAVLPISTFLFNSFSTVFLIANIIFIPIVSFIMVLGFLACVIPMIEVLLNPLLSIYLYGVKFLASFEYSQINISSMLYIGIFAYYILLFELLLKKGNRNYIYFTLLVAILCFSIIPQLRFNNFEMNFLSCGNGDSIYIRTENNVNIIVDGGNDKIQFGKYGLVPYLLKRGILKVDILIATHSDSDHAKELISVIDSLKVSALFLPYINNVKEKEKFEKLIKSANKNEIPIYYIKKNDIINIGQKTKLEVLSPKKEDEFDNPNSYSLVIKLHYRELEVLLTGDIEKEKECELSLEDVRSDVLKVPHHGSSSSSTIEFLNSVNYHVCIISCGENNFGHPNKEVVKRLKEKGTLYITQDVGRVKIYERRNAFYLNTYK